VQKAVLTFPEGNLNISKRQWDEHFLEISRNITVNERVQAIVNTLPKKTHQLKVEMV